MGDGFDANPLPMTDEAGGAAPESRSHGDASAAHEGDEVATLRRRWRRGLLAAIALLYVASVPWYRDADAPVGSLLGLPDWVAVALLCYVAVAILNSVAWLLTDIQDPQPLPQPSARDSSESSPHSGPST